MCSTREHGHSTEPAFVCAHAGSSKNLKDQNTSWVDQMAGACFAHRMLVVIMHRGSFLRMVRKRGGARNVGAFPRCLQVAVLVRRCERPALASRTCS